MIEDFKNLSQQIKALPNIPDTSKWMIEIQGLQAELQDAQHASGFYRRLMEMIVEFEEKIDRDKEVGIKLVTFGQTITLYIDDIGYYNPHLITFEGSDGNGNTVKLIQHTSQISFLLIAIPKRSDEPERRRIGYFLRQRLEEEEE